MTAEQTASRITADAIGQAMLGYLNERVQAMTRLILWFRDSADTAVGDD
jgi:hypothetical protein